MTVGQKLRAMRKKRRLSLAQLGELCGMTGAAIATYERDERIPKKKALEKLAKAFDLPVSKLTETLTLESNAADQQGTNVLYGAILNELEHQFLSVESKRIINSLGGCTQYYFVEELPDSFVLYENDIAAIAQTAKVSLLPMIERMRQSQLEKLG